MLRLCFTGCILLILGACSQYASNGERLYLESRNGPKLEVPPPLTRENISGFYNLPQQHQNPRVDIKPPITSEIKED